MLEEQTKNNVISIVDYAITNKFEFFLHEYWCCFFKILSKDSFRFFGDKYQDKYYLPNMIKELLLYYSATKCLPLDRIIEKITQQIPEKNQNIAGQLYQSIKQKLEVGYCWKTIKHLIKIVKPPMDLIDLSLQEMQQNSNLTHSKQLYEFINTRLTKEDKSNLNQDNLKKLHDLLNIQYEDNKDVAANRYVPSRFLFS